VNPNDFWRNLDGKRIAIAGGGIFLGLALLDNAYRDGLRTGLLLASQSGSEVRWRDLDHGFSFGPWLFLAAIVGFVGWRKGWWGGGGNGNRPSGPNGHGRSLTPPAWAPQPPATAPVPPAPTPAPAAPAAPPSASTATTQPQSQQPTEVRIPVTVAGQAAAPTSVQSPPVAGPLPPDPPPLLASAPVAPAATPEATAPEYRRTVGETG
jgi:hypothetical protein